MYRKKWKYNDQSLYILKQDKVVIQSCKKKVHLRCQIPPHGLRQTPRFDRNPWWCSGDARSPWSWLLRTIPESSIESNGPCPGRCWRWLRPTLKLLGRRRHNNIKHNKNTVKKKSAFQGSMPATNYGHRIQKHGQTSMDIYSTICISTILSTILKKQISKNKSQKTNLKKQFSTNLNKSQQTIHPPLDRRSKARAMQNNWRCPTLKLLPPSATRKSNPFG